jgi:hypothetical protein
MIFENMMFYVLPVGTLRICYNSGFLQCETLKRSGLLLLPYSLPYGNKSVSSSWSWCTIPHPTLPKLNVPNQTPWAACYRYIIVDHQSPTIPIAIGTLQSTIHRWHTTHPKYIYMLFSSCYYVVAFYNARASESYITTMTMDTSLFLLMPRARSKQTPMPPRLGWTEGKEEAPAASGAWPNFHGWEKG